MRPPVNGSIQVSPTWSGQTSPATSRRRPAIGENTAPGIASVVGAKRGGRGITGPPTARVAERITRSQQPRIATPLAATARLTALIGARDPRQRHAEHAGEPAQY